MASTLKGVSLRTVFVSGQKSDGTPEYTSMSVGAINPETYDDTKGYNLAHALAYIVKHSFDRVEKVETSRLTA